MAARTRPEREQGEAEELVLVLRARERLVRFFTREGTRGRSGRFFLRAAMLGRFDALRRAPSRSAAVDRLHASCPYALGEEVEEARPRRGPTPTLRVRHVGPSDRQRSTTVRPRQSS